MTATKSTAADRNRKRILGEAQQALKDLKDINRFQAGLIDRLARTIEDLASLPAPAQGRAAAPEDRP